MAKLLVMVKGQVAREVPIVGDNTRIGREHLNHVRLDDPTVSRFHAEIIRRGYCYAVEDRQSTNGTFINGKVLQPREVLGDGDTITVGGQTLVFVLEEHDRTEPLTLHSFDSSETLRFGSR